MTAAPRIMMSCDAIGGVWQYSLDLCRTLTAQGSVIALAVLGPPPGPRQRAQAEAIDGLSLFETGHDLDWTAADPRRIEEAGEHLALLAAAHDADIVHLNSPALAAAADFPAPVVTVAHSCVGTWWDAVRGGPLPADLAWRDELHRTGLDRADLAIAPSRSFAAATAAHHRLARMPLAIHNGRVASGASSRAMHDFAFTAGRLWDDAKNLATLDRAAARLSVPFRAAGPCDGPNGEHIDFAAIAPLGHLDDEAVADRLASRPVFVSASLYEPFGLAVLEAAMAGCPLVLSDIPTFRELWADVAVFVDPRDDFGFAEAIDRLIGDARIRIERGDAARIRARRYCPVATGTATMAAYRRLLDGNTLPARARALA
ncbi:glycosyltransferase family 4 protein [Rhizorhabdus histidinilytica]|uniref:glycosyltransferase family 4 protein n=1 Tax=Rhizorhabdus histidinilytica TaxID=439228 RepID=UPI00321F8AC5